MSAPKVFVFAPADPTGETHQRLSNQGCARVFGDPAWEHPNENNEVGAEQFGLRSPPQFFSIQPGGGVDEAALVEALEGDRIDGAALDANRA